MGVFHTYADTPFQLKTEGETITLTFAPGVPAAGQGTVSWNAPVPGADCTTAQDGRFGGYAGMVIVLSSKPITPAEYPVDGVVYSADPTANADLHAGDKIGDALVIGAFYEAAKKARGEDQTVGFVVNDVTPNTPYYVAGFAVDAQNRYHTEGVRAYSDEYVTTNTGNRPSTQEIIFGGVSILPTDGTGLLPGAFYEFDMLLDNTYPNRTNEKVYRIRVDGTNCGTYQDLVNELNKQFALLENPIQLPTAPNAGRLYWDATNKKLYQFNGTEYVLIEDVLVESTDPAQVAIGEYWHKPSTGELFISSTSPAAWTPASVIDYGTVDPRSFKTTDQWFDGTQGYYWNGTVWCEVPTIVSTTDPSCPPALPGTFWYDSTNQFLYSWSEETTTWEARAAVMWNVAPNALVAGTFWFDLNTNKLFQYSGSPWTEQTNVTISTTAPALPAAGAFWFNPQTEVLKQWNFIGQQWDTLNVLVWPGDPTDVVSCDLWWRSTDDTLFVWDSRSSVWVQVSTFFQSAVDPQLPPTIAPGTLWSNPDTSVVLRWDGASWVETSVVISSTDPTTPTPGDAWFDSANNQWYVWEVPSTGVWNAIDAIESEEDPTTLANGTYWFNTTSNVLSERNGLSWIATGYSTTSLTPAKNSMYLNLTDGKLYQWNGSKWIHTLPIIFARINEMGLLQFETRERSGGMNTMVLVPGTDGELGTGLADFGYLDMGQNFYRTATPSFPTSDVSDAAFLFYNFPAGAKIKNHIYGADAVSQVPSYMEMGVGTDGSPEERRELVDSIRRQLGYPTVAVELTKEQLELAVRLGLENFRRLSGSAYKRGFFFLDTQPRQQTYVLTNRQIGYHKIVNVTAIYRFTSAFLSSAHGAGVYGQVVLQHLYNMGTYDLTSYHLVAQYVEQMEHLFATRMTFQWHEATRTLDMYNSFLYRERVLLDCTLERTEQELFKDRLTKNWIRSWALAEAMLMLGQIRGKYASLPGAGGGVQLNASELITSAESIKERLYMEIDDYVASEVEDLGLGTTFTIG